MIFPASVRYPKGDLQPPVGSANSPPFAYKSHLSVHQPPVIQSRWGNQPSKCTMMLSGNVPICSYIDGSPYAYMGVKVLSRYRDYWGDRVDVEFIPFFLGGIMVGAG